MHGNRVLIVDDEAIIGYDLEVRLGKLGYDVLEVACSPDEAYRIAINQRPDIILMDINLNNEKDGIETYQWIRESVDIPVMFISAFTDGPTLARAKAVMPLGYLTKPMRDDQLEDIILRLGTMGTGSKQSVE